MKALDHMISNREASQKRNTSSKSPSSIKTHVSTVRRERLRERPPPPTPRSSSLKKLDEMLSDSSSSDESDFDDDDTSTIRRSKRVRKSVDRFQPSPNKKERQVHSQYSIDFNILMSIIIKRKGEEACTRGSTCPRKTI